MRQARDDLGVSGVNANVQLAPGAALYRPVLFKQPFAGGRELLSGLIS
jgi:hypothetical protein